MKIGQQLFSPDYQQVIIVSEYGRFAHSRRRWVRDSSGVYYFAESFRKL
jgi:hypothetical protein